MPDRIVLLGRAGVGKTTLARRLGETTGAPVICLDAMWKPGWTAADVPTFRETIAPLHSGDSWISDGNFADATFDLRLPRATLILWLDAPRLLCTWRSLGRVCKPGEPHRASNLLSVIRFIWRFDRVNRPRIESAILRYGPNIPVRRINGTRQMARFLAETQGQPGDK